MLSLSKTIILGSKSPRRREILKLAGLDHKVLHIDHAEVMPAPPYLPADIPLYLARQKADSITGLQEDEILITADTVVILKNKIIGKPKDMDHAFQILESLSGHMHEVVSGVCIRTANEEYLISDLSRVYFKELEVEEIEYYIENHEVMDKAGAYGVQDWMGLVGIEKIEGSYFNVMGLPIHKVYERLKYLAEH